MANLSALETAEKYLQLRAEVLSPAGQGFPFWYARNTPDARPETAWAYYMGFIDAETFEFLRTKDESVRIATVRHINGL